MAVRHDFSVGGVAVDEDGRIALVRSRNFKGRATWGLPKGHPEPGESNAQAAAREVAEETGYRVSLDSEEPVTAIDYWFTARDGGRVHKHVDWYAMRIVGETGDGPDAAEIDEVALLTADEATRRLTYSGERRVLREVLGR